MLTFKIESETDLHVKVVHLLKKRYPHSLFTVTLGENQDTVYKRIDSFKKGYLRVSLDLIINNPHKLYTGFCIEMKTPKGNGVLSPDQSMMLRQYQNNGFKTLVSNDYDHIIEQIIEYFRDVRILCSYCPRRFISSQSLKNHIKGECRVQHKLGSNERALNFQKNEPLLTFIRQLVLEISRLKVKNMDIAIFLISSLIFV